MASYSYTPYDSCHAYSTLLGIVATETVRLLRTNLLQADFDAQIAFFIGKLKLRGYDVKMIRTVIKRYQWIEKEAILNRHACKRAKMIVPLKLPFSPKLPQLFAARIFQAHEALLPPEIQASLRPMLALQTAPNLFRQRYSRFC